MMLQQAEQQTQHTTNELFWPRLLYPKQAADQDSSLIHSNGESSSHKQNDLLLKSNTSNLKFVDSVKQKL